MTQDQPASELDTRVWGGTPAPPERLWGLPDAEQMWLDPAGVYESEIDPNYDFDEGSEDRARSWVIEEWSVRDTLDLVPTAEWILEWITEHMADELDEGGYGHLAGAMNHDEVVAATEALRQLIASKVTYRMADRLIGGHRLHINDQGEPMLDDEPLYSKNAQPADQPTAEA